MPQVYHSNAKTNSHTRGMIQKSNLSNVIARSQCRIGSEGVRERLD